MRGGPYQLTSLDYINESASYLNISNCTNGQYYHDNEVGPARMLEVCVNGQNRTMF
jgi:hypothetical protein